MKHGDDLNNARVVVNPVPELVREDVQTQSASPTANDTTRVREVFESPCDRVELVDESFGLIGCLGVVPSQNAISILSGVRGETDVVRHAVRRRERTARSSSSSVT